MAKSVKKAAKKVAKKVTAKKKFASLFTNEVLTETTNLAGLPIAKFGSIFNPEIGSGSIRINFPDGQHKDFDNVSAAVFAATIAILRSGRAAYNGQYITAIN